METFQNTFFYLFVIIIIGSFASVYSINKHDSNTNAIKKFGPKRYDVSLSPSSQSGDAYYEDESEWQGSEDHNEPWLPPPPPPHLPEHHVEHESYSHSPLQKRFGHKIFGDDFGLFLVLLTIAGFFGLLM